MTETPIIRRETSKITTIIVNRVELQRTQLPNGEFRVDIKAGPIKELMLNDAEWRSFHEVMLYLSGVDQLHAEGVI